jgi:ABC-type branched-subunit amino acid transport system substrate-binding protein
MQALERAGAIVVVGPLVEPELSAAVFARVRPIPLISPTAPHIVAGAENVYTLGGPDLAGSRALARWAAGSGISRVALLHPRGVASEEEASAFTDAFREAGGSVLGQFLYDHGTTYFQTHMQSIEALRPDALVLPIPAEDVEIVAPQITFFGIDTLDVRILGTGGWTHQDVLGTVSARHTDGVVAITPDPVGQGESPGVQALVRAYEALYRRTLRSPVPAVGYDAAALMLEALRGGARSPTNIAAALGRIAAFPGATGQLGIENGRAMRGNQLVCMQDQTMSLIATGEQPILIDRRPEVLPGEEPPAMDGPPFQVVCPGTRLPGGI